MAFSAVTGRGSATESNSDTTIAVNPTGTITVGKILFAAAVTDNIQTTDGASTLHSISDSGSNSWTKIFEETETDGSAADGSTTSLWWSKITTQLTTGSTVTLTTSSAVSDKIIGIFEVTVGTGNTIAVAGTPAKVHNSLEASLSSLTSREYLWVGLFGAEGEDETKTPDADYTEQFDLVSTTSGLPAANCQMQLQTRIATLTGDTCTSADITYTNGVQTLTAVYEVAGPQSITPSLTQRLAATFSATIKKEQFITPALKQQTVSPFAPTVKKEQFLSPSLTQQLAASFAPKFGRNLKPILQQQPTAAFTIRMGRTVKPGLISQTVTPFGPTIESIVLEVTPGLIQQLAQTFGPTFGQTITPTLTLQTATPYTITLAASWILTPNGDGTIEALFNETHAFTNLYQSIDDDPATPTLTDWVTSGENNGTGFVELTATPADFGSIVSITIRAYLTSTDFTTDTCDLYGRLYDSTETVPYTDDTFLGDETTNGLVILPCNLTAAGLAASKSDWDSARIRLSYDYT